MHRQSAADRLMADAAAGRLTRRRALEAGLKLGLATPVIAAIVAAAPAGAAAAPAPAPAPAFNPARAAQAGGSTFTVVRDGSTPDIDPHSAYDNLASMLFFGLYEMLVQYKDDRIDEIAPMLAESWEENDDQSVVTFRLAPNAVFHDGTPCDAEAVQKAFTRFLLMDTGPVNVIKRFVTDPAQIVAVDPVTIRFDLGRPQPLFLSAMASSFGPLVTNWKEVEANKTDDDPWAHEWFLTNASGTGPYVLTENNLTEVVIMEKFEAYHGGWEGPHFDRIVVRIVPEVSTRRQLLEAGEADATALNLTPEIVDAIGSNPDLQVVSYPSSAVFWVIMNAATLNVDARKGFSYAFPYEQVTDSAYRGLIQRSGPLASMVRGADPDVFLYQTDLAKAGELIEAAGFPPGSGFTYSYASGSETEQVIAQLFQASLQEMGYTLTLEPLERGALVDLVYGDSEPEARPDFIGGWGWWPDYNDPWNQFSPNFTDKTKDGISNGGYWLNPRFEELMDEAASYEDEARLTEIMLEAQNILTEQDPPVIYYGELLWYSVLRSDVKGFVPNALYLNAFPFYRMYRES
ncbi:MAG: ABC transporter substrate-binding protein [Chloroflexota bacterium]